MLIKITYQHLLQVHLILKKIRYLHPIRIPKHPALDPHITRLGQIAREWDGSERADAAIVGIPFDGSIDHRARRGARLGPCFIREVLYAKSTFYLELDTDIGNLKIVDCGDVNVTTNFRESHRRIEAALTPIFESGMVPVIIGGDHSATYPSIRALCNSMEDGKRLGVIDFDSHHDCRSGLEEVSGLWVREIQEIEKTTVRGKNIVQIGVHGSAYSQFYRDYVRKTGITVFTPIDVRKRGVDTITKEALDLASDGVDVIYVSVDIDVLDQTFAPGTLAPTPGGLTSWDVIESIIEISRHPLVRALDIMEVAPPLDADNMTSKVAAEIIMNFLCGLSQKKSSKH